MALLPIWVLHGRSGTERTPGPQGGAGETTGHDMGVPSTSRTSDALCRRCLSPPWPAASPLSRVFLLVPPPRRFMRVHPNPSSLRGCSTPRRTS
jgi:hypothetical protein